MSDAAPPGGCRVTASCSPLSDLQHARPVPPGQNGEDHSSHEILGSAIGGLPKQSPNNSQNIDHMEKNN
jgi:hypothetical protein